MEAKLKTYVVALRSRASAVFYPNDALSLNYVVQGREQAPISLKFTTTYDPNSGFDVPPPRDLLVEARGLAESLHDAGELFGNAALSINKKARAVSDGFEHGFSDLDEMRKPASEATRESRTARDARPELPSCGLELEDKKRCHRCGWKVQLRAGGNRDRENWRGCKVCSITL